MSPDHRCATSLPCLLCRLALLLLLFAPTAIVPPAYGAEPTPDADPPPLTPFRLDAQPRTATAALDPALLPIRFVRTMGNSVRMHATYGSDPSTFAASDDYLFFLARVDVERHGWWRTDGEAPLLLQEFDSTLRTDVQTVFAGPKMAYYFASDSVSAAYTIWRSDGHGPGAEQAGTAPALPDPRWVSVTPDDTLYYITGDQQGGFTLWRLRPSDSTPRALWISGAPGGQGFDFVLAATGQGLFLLVGGPGRTPTLYLQSSSREGLRRVADLPQGPLALTPLGDQVFFFTDSLYPTVVTSAAVSPAALTSYLWTSDGTAAGTHALGWSSTAPIHMVMGANERLWIVTGAADFTGPQPPTTTFWQLAPDAPAPIQIATLELQVLAIRPGATPDELTVDGVDSISGPWKSYRLRPGAAPELRFVYPDRGFGAFIGDQFLFFRPTLPHNQPQEQNLELHVQSMGEEPIKVKEIGPGTANCMDYYDALYLAFKEKLFFMANDGIHGKELWVSDGTPAGTRMLADINRTPIEHIAPGPGPGSWVQPLFASGDRAFFAVDDGLHGRQLWVSDGHTLGTRPLLHSDMPDYWQLDAAVDQGTTVTFTFVDPVAPAYELWQFTGDGKLQRLARWARGHLDLYPVSDGVLAVGKVEPAADDASSRQEGVWRVDAAGGAPVPVSPADAPTGEAIDTPLGIGRSGDLVFFWRTTPDQGQEVWRSDGSAAGTFLIHDFTPGPGGSRQAGVWPGMGFTFLLVDSTLWRTSGAAGNVTALRDLNQDGWRGLRGGYPAGSRFYLLGYLAPAGELLVASDGTSGGTAVMRSIPGDNVGSPGLEHLQVIGDSLYFTVGAELWRSQGTRGSTGRIATPSFSGIPVQIQAMAPLGDQLLFTAFLFPALSLWQSDGSQKGTRPLAAYNIYAPEVASSLAVAGTNVFFSAQVPERGTELLQVDTRAPGAAYGYDLYAGAFSSYPDGYLRAGNLLFFLGMGPGPSQNLWVAGELGPAPLGPVRLYLPALQQ